MDQFNEGNQIQSNKQDPKSNKQAESPKKKQKTKSSTGEKSGKWLRDFTKMNWQRKEGEKQTEYTGRLIRDRLKVISNK